MTETRGDCYDAAARMMIDVNMSGDRGAATLVHGVVTGTGGEALGVRYGHAWVEIGDEVFDRSNGRDIVIPREVYYEIGSIDPDEGIRYDYEAMRKELVRAKHYGPWDERVAINVN